MSITDQRSIQMSTNAAFNCRLSKKSIMKKIVTYTTTIFLALFIVSVASAQQDARYSQYMFNGLLLNPAYAGSAGATSLTGFYRTQWVGIDGAPETFSFSAHTPLGGNKQYGVGGFLEYDQIGVNQRLRAFGSYSYRIPISNRGDVLSIGIQGGGLYLNSDLTSVALDDPNAPIANPDVAFGDNITRFLPNVGLGLYYYRDRFFAGLAAPHLLDNRIRENAAGGGISLLSRQYRHYWFSTGIVFPVGENFMVRPSVLVKAIPGNAPTQVDANLSVLLMKTLWLGSSFRFADAFEPESVNLIAMFQTESGLRIGYAYDYTLSDLNQYTSGSHEITLGIDLGGDNDRMRTPRYF